MAPGVYDSKFDVTQKRSMVALLDSSVTSLHSNFKSAQKNKPTMSNTMRSFSSTSNSTEKFFRAARGDPQLLQTMEV